MTLDPEYEVLFYERPDGESPTRRFLSALPVKARAKIGKWIELLAIHGPNLPRPYADTVLGKIRELRVQTDGMSYRLLYFFAGKKIVITHGFVKKTDKVPVEELNRAVRFMNDFLDLLQRGETKK